MTNCGRLETQKTHTDATTKNKIWNYENQKTFSILAFKGAVHKPQVVTWHSVRLFLFSYGNPVAYIVGCLVLNMFILKKANTKAFIIYKRNCTQNNLSDIWAITPVRCNFVMHLIKLLVTIVNFINKGTKEWFIGKVLTHCSELVLLRYVMIA